MCDIGETDMWVTFPNGQRRAVRPLQAVTSLGGLRDTSASKRAVRGGTITVRKHKSELSDFYLDLNYRAKATKKVEHAAFHDPDADDLFGCPIPPPGVDIHEAEEGLYDNPDEVQKRAHNVQEHLKRCSARRNSTSV